MKAILKCIMLVAALVTGTLTAQAQVKIGDNPTVIAPASALEIESTNKGLRMPQISLTNTTTWAPMLGSGTAATSPGMHVYNTNPAITSTNVNYPTLAAKIGEYYWDGTGWVALAPSGTFDSPVQVSAYFGSFYVTAGSYSKLNFTSARFDKNNSLDLTNDQVVIPLSGYYQVSGNIGTNYQSYAQGVYVTAFVNGVNQNIVMSGNSIAGAGVTANGSALLKLNAGDILDFRVSSSAPVSGGGGEITISFVSQ